jgi:chaperonin GroES
MIVPILHRLLIKPDNVETKTASGIIVSLNEKREQAAAEKGVIIAIGDTAFKDFKAEVIPSVGDRVYFAKYAGKEVVENEEKFLLVNDEDCLGVIK